MEEAGQCHEGTDEQVQAQDPPQEDPVQHQEDRPAGWKHGLVADGVDGQQARAPLVEAAQG
jgi:hypothetical protein